MVQLFHPDRHLGLGSTVDNCDVAAQTPRGTGCIHGGIAAADHHHLLTLGRRQRCLVLLLVCLHQIDAGEVLVGGEYPQQMLAGNVQTRQTGAGTDENLPESRPLYLRKRRGLADQEVGDELSAHQPDLLHHVIDQGVGQANSGMP